MIQSWILPGLEYSGVQQSTVQFSGDFLVERSPPLHSDWITENVCIVFQHSDLAQALCTNTDCKTSDSYLLCELCQTVGKQSIYWWRGRGRTDTICGRWTSLSTQILAPGDQVFQNWKINWTGNNSFLPSFIFLFPDMQNSWIDI